MSRIYLGVDPGMTGAVGILFPDASPQAHRIPVETFQLKEKTKPRMIKGKLTAGGNPRTSSEVHYTALCDIFAEYADMHHDPDYPHQVHVAIEWNRSRPTDTPVTANAMGMGLGVIVGMLTALVLPWSRVYPHVWKVKCNCQKDDATKKKARRRAGELFPDCGVDFTIKRNNGLAEALLIADYARKRDASH